MSDVFDLDTLENGEPGALERMTGGLAEAGLPFEVIGHRIEAETSDIRGSLAGLDEHRAAIEAPGDWVEGCLMLPETILFGRHGLPYIPSLDRFLLGDGLNKPVERYGAPDSAGPAAAAVDQGAPTRIGGMRPIERFRTLDVPDPSGATRLDRAFVIAGRGAATYGHWLLDFVPQLLTALKTAERLGIDAPILVINVTPFGKRLLKFLGVHDRCRFAERDEMFRIGRLYFPLITKLRRRYCIGTLRESYGHLLGLSESARASVRRAGYDKILIARRRPPFCGNFDALRAALEPRGFRVLHPEQFHYRKQFQLFNNASIVVGEDGSAMHNAGFCRPGTPLVVWSRADKANFWHGPVSQAAGLPLYYLQSSIAEDGAQYDAPVDEILQIV